MPGAKLICTFVVVLFVLVAGCGGNGQEGAAGPLPDDSGGAANIEIGPLVVQTARTGNFKAVDIPSPYPYGCSFVALYGAQIDYLASTAMLDRVVFTSERSGNLQIYVCNLDGSGSSLVRLTNNNAKDEYPRWSPDGTKIAFCRTWPKKNVVICTMNADGSGATTITSDAYTSWAPEWSPEGGRIAFDRVVGQRWDVHTMNADGKNILNLTSTHGTTNLIPAWSPDGRTIVFATNKYGTVVDLASIGAYGGAATRITNNSFNNQSPAFCPQLDYGIRIAYASSRGGKRDIFIANIDGSNETNLTAHSADYDRPRWSSDGRLIAFESDRSGNPDVWVQEVDPPHAVWQVTKHSAYDETPDLGSPTMQTERVLIGPDGSDRGGKNPLYPSAPAVIAAFNAEGYRNLVRIGVAAADLASLQVQPLSVGTAQMAAVPSMPGVEVSAKKIPNLREDAGWGKPAKVWDFTSLNPGMLLLYFNSETGKLATVVTVKDSAYSSAVGRASDTTYRVNPAGDGVQLTGSFSGVFDAEGRNLAESGASSVTLGADGQVLQVN